MRTTIDVRIDERLLRRLEERAAATGVSVAELASELLARAIADPPLVRRAKHLRGQLTGVREPLREWSNAIRENNARG